jgi:hypothetical protein
LGERENQGSCIYDPEDLLRSCGQLRIKGDNRFEEILKAKKIIYSEGGHVLTPFFGKNRSKGIRWKAEYNQPIEGRIEQSTRSADGQKGLALIVGQQVRAIRRWQTTGSADEHEEGGIQRNMPDRKYGGGGSIHD